MSSNNENDYKAKLIAVVKKEVKQLMEESVTRKFVHEESGSVTALCGAVEACLSQGLRRRALGLFKTSSTTALLHKIAKHCKEAAIISKKVQEIENSDPNRRSSSSSDSLTKPSSSSSSSITTTSQTTTTTTTTTTSSSSTQTTQSSTTSLKRTSPTLTNLSSLQQQQQLPKYLWIRLALFEKQLSKIIDYLVANATKYYDKDALVADPDYGSILSSLLVGPCALDYSHTKTQDHYWTDPPADELVQRHRISSGGHITPPSIRRPILNFRRSLNTSSDDPVSVRNNQHQHLAKDYVESLHQNSRATLLFGKNNVLVLPINAVDITQPIPGYLSLHQTANGLIIKWTPNQLMNGFTSDDCASQQQQQKDQQQQETNVYWDYALQVRLDEIVYVHCHQDSETGGTIILVGQDGVQRPPIHFPRGGHMLAFLSCIETGLLPRGRLDPPLWSQRTNNNNNNNNSNSGNGAKNVTNRKRRPLPALAESEETTTQITKDYVFRIVDNSSHKEILKRNELMDRHISFPNRVRIQLPSTSTSSDSSTKSFSIEQQNLLITDDNNSPPPTVCIQAVCDSMKRQIISRAFYGWLAYCRHLSTVRTHLSGLVNSKIINGDDNDVKNGITIEKWSALCSNGIVDDYNEVYRLTYFGGIAHDLRKDIWPYLLGHYKFGSTVEQRNELSEETKQAYENTMSEWLAVEAIVRQRDKETQANAIAKLSSESTSGEQPPPTHIPRDLSNDVFEDMSDDDDSAPVIDDTIQHPKRTKQNTIQYESDNDDGENANHADNVDNADDDDECTKIDPHAELKDFIHNVIVTNASVDMSNLGGENDTNQRNNNLDAVVEENNSSLDTCIETHGLASPARSACVSPASSNGGVYSQELLETFGLNLHRIEKDVQRCDRNYWYFAGENLDKLRNVMCTYVWEHLDIGYMQGMCDLVAPLLVIFNDESLTYACFCHLMERMVENFPNGNQMDCHFANMRSLIQILDSEMYELMHQQGDYTHFYFCYRWFLLDFKRELIYPDIFTTWEIIWAAQYVSSNHFVLFIALALLETYRDIILSNGMDFTDIIKFFNEMAEHHDAQAVLRLARELVLQLQLLIENK